MVGESSPAPARSHLQEQGPCCHLTWMQPRHKGCRASPKNRPWAISHHRRPCLPFQHHNTGRVTIMRLSPRAPKPQESSHSSGQCRQVPGAILGIPGQSEASRELRASSLVARECTEQTRNVKKRVPRGIIQKSQYTHAKIAVQSVLEMPGNK